MVGQCGLHPEAQGRALEPFPPQLYFPAKGGGYLGEAGVHAHDSHEAETVGAFT